MMKKSIENIIGLLVGVSIVLGLLVVLFRDDAEPDMLPLVAGCFVTHDSKTRIRVTANGNIIFDNKTLAVRIVRDKEGLSIIPSKRLERSQSGALYTTGGNPLKMRIDRSYDTLSFIGDDGAVTFARIDCRKV